MAWIEFINGAKRALAFTPDRVGVFWVYGKNETPAGPPGSMAHMRVTYRYRCRNSSKTNASSAVGCCRPANQLDTACGVTPAILAIWRRRAWST